MRQPASVKATATPPPTAARRPKRVPAETRRRQILLAAIRLFAEKGFRGTTTKEIAAAAGVNEALIFRHFATKEELYAAILDFKTSQADAGVWISELDGFAKRHDDEGLLTGLARKILDHYGQDREFLHLMLYSALEGHDLARMFDRRQFLPLKRFLRDYLARRQREGVFRRGNPDALVRAFIGMPSHHALVTGLLGGDRIAIDDEEAVAAFTGVFLDGVRRQSQPRDRQIPGRRKKEGKKD